MPNKRCRLHGGLTPVGSGLPQTTVGRYSKHLPTRLAGRYAEAQADPELLSLREEMALVDARIGDVLGRVDTREAGLHWRSIASRLDDYRRAMGPGEKEQAVEAIEFIASEAQTDYAAWAEVLELVERRRKLAETETKRLEKMGQAITAERAMLLLAAVVDVVRTHVTDRAVLAGISRDLGRLVDGRTQPPA